jgi:hypothetical protein
MGAPVHGSNVAGAACAQVGALALLVANDHPLKGRWPGWLTGKLSNLAGVFLPTVVLGVLGGRPASPEVLEAARFVAVKRAPQPVSDPTQRPREV